MPKSNNFPTSSSGQERPVFPKIGLERYQRLLGIAEEIEAHGPPAPVVLDVGGHDAHLSEFLPSATYVEYNEFIVPESAPLPYGNDSFDVVVASDVLEHVLPEHRDFFLKELIRVSKSLVVFSFPNPEALPFEKMVMEYFPKHDWLLEHEEMGLPSPEAVKACLNDCGVRFSVKDNGSLCGWLCGYMLHLMLGEQRYKLNEFLQRMCYEHENTAPAYRSIYTVWTEGATIKKEQGAASGKERPKASLVIPVYNQKALTLSCLAALEKATDRTTCEIVVVDNNSEQDTYDALHKHPAIDVYIRNTINRGFAAACNQGARAASAPYLVFLNNDTEVQSGWLDAMLERVESSPEIGAVGSKLLYPDGTLQHCGVVVVRQENGALLLPRHVFAGIPPNALTNRAVQFQAVTAACLLVESTLFDETGGFDESYWNGSEDVDLCFKIGLAGRTIVYEPKSVVVHHESKSGPERYAGMRNNNALLQERWKDVICPDLIQSGAGVTPGESSLAVLDAGGAFTDSYLQAACHWWDKKSEPLRPHDLLHMTKCVVNSCAPTRNHQNWGDASYASEVVNALQRAEIEASVAYVDEWDKPIKSPCAVSIHLRGLTRYQPDPDHYNILWLISHPELVTEEELRAYDMVFCCSKRFARLIASQFKIPCIFLPQATSQDFLDFRSTHETQDIDVLFVGNNYPTQQGPCRKIVEDFLKAGIDCNFKVVGERWEGVIPPENILGKFVPRESLASLYSCAKIVLNDHHPTMAEFGFVNNRTYDLMALGVAQVCNAMDGLQDLGIVSYSSIEDLRIKVQKLLQNDTEREAYAAKGRKLAERYTFDQAVATMLRFSGETVNEKCHAASQLPASVRERLSARPTKEELERQIAEPCADQQWLENNIITYLQACDVAEQSPALGQWLFQRLTRHGYLRGPEEGEHSVSVFLTAGGGDTAFDSICSLLHQTRRDWRLLFNAYSDESLSPAMQDVMPAFAAGTVTYRKSDANVAVLDTAAQQALFDAEYMLLLSPEVVLAPEFIEQCVQCLAKNPQLGYVSAAVLEHGANNKVSTPSQEGECEIPAALIRVAAMKENLREEEITISSLSRRSGIESLLRQGFSGVFLEHPLLCIKA